MIQLKVSATRFEQIYKQREWKQKIKKGKLIHNTQTTTKLIIHRTQLYARILFSIGFVLKIYRKGKKRREVRTSDCAKKKQTAFIDFGVNN